MALFSSSMRTEAAKIHPDLHVVFEIDLSASTLRYALPGVSSDTHGSYEERVQEMSTYGRGVSHTNNQLELTGMSVLLDDTDGEISKLLTGSTAHEFKDATVRCRVLSANVTDANAFTFFTGRLDRWELDGSRRQWRFHLALDDLPLSRQFPKQSLTQFLFSQADGEVYGIYAPMIYGSFRSAGITDEGAVPTFYVKTDSNPFQYLVCIGIAFDVPKVYVDGVQQATSAYSITTPVVKGKQFTMIEFTTDQGDAIITCDVDGYEDQGDGGGHLLTNPADQFEHWLENFAYGDYKSGLWQVGNAPIDDTSWGNLVTFLTNEGGEGSRYLGGDNVQRTVKEEFNLWCDSLEVKAYWTTSGTIGVNVIDHTETDVYAGDLIYRELEDEHGSFSLRFDTTKEIDRISVQHLQDPSRGAFTQDLEVRDHSFDKEAAEAKQMFWSSGRLV